MQRVSASRRRTGTTRFCACSRRRPGCSGRRSSRCFYAGGRDGHRPAESGGDESDEEPLRCESAHPEEPAGVSHADGMLRERSSGARDERAQRAPRVEQQPDGSGLATISAVSLVRRRPGSRRRTRRARSAVAADALAARATSRSDTEPSGRSRRINASPPCAAIDSPEKRIGRSWLTRSRIRFYSGPRECSSVCAMKRGTPSFTPSGHSHFKLRSG